MNHSQSDSIHKAAYIRSTDPADDFPGRMQAGVLWLDTTSTPYLLKKRNDDNDGWNNLGYLLNEINPEGDLDGTLLNPVVIGLQMRAVADTPPSDGQVLTWNLGATQWEPQDPAGSTAAAEDVTFDPSGLAIVSATDVQAALEELDAAVDGLGGTPNAAGISFDPSGLAIVTGMDVQAALEELDAAVDGISAGGNATQIQGRAVHNGAPSDGQVLKWSTSNNRWEPAADDNSGGGGGGGASAGAFGSRPSASTAGNLYLATDTPILSRDTGSAWQHFGPVFPLTAPNDGAFSWRNQGGASVTADKGRILLTAPAAGGVNYRFRYKACPTPPYTITAAFFHGLFNQNYNRCGIGFSDGTKWHIWGIISDSGQYKMWVEALNSATSWSGSIGTFTGYPVGGLVWLRIVDDNTNRLYQWSTDGMTWLTLYSHARTTFFTPTEVGFYVTSEGSYAPSMNLVSWLEA